MSIDVVTSGSPPYIELSCSTEGERTVLTGDWSIRTRVTSDNIGNGVTRDQVIYSIGVMGGVGDISPRVVDNFEFSMVRVYRDSGGSATPPTAERHAIFQCVIDKRDDRNYSGLVNVTRITFGGVDIFGRFVLASTGPYGHGRYIFSVPNFEEVYEPIWITDTQYSQIRIKAGNMTSVMKLWYHNINRFYYDKISNRRVVIAPGDKLLYGMQLRGTIPVSGGIDCIINDEPSNVMRQRHLPDQNGLSIHPATDSTAFSHDKWYDRVFDLTPLAGNTLGHWAAAIEGDENGIYQAFFRDIRVVSADGTVKLNIFSDTLEVPQREIWYHGGSGLIQMKDLVKKVSDGAKWDRVTQPYYKLSADNWVKLKKVFVKTAPATWKEVWPMEYVYIHTGYGYEMDIHKCFGFPTEPAVYRFINNGKIGGTVGVPFSVALTTGVFPAGSILIIENNGDITGAGGDGGCINTNQTLYGALGGGHGLELRADTIIINNGTIGGGGGGAGASADMGGKTWYHIWGPPGAGIPPGRALQGNWRSGYVSGPGLATETTGGPAGTYTGPGGNRGQAGAPAPRAIPDDFPVTSIGAPGGTAIINGGHVHPSSTGLGTDRVFGLVRPGKDGAPNVYFANYHPFNTSSNGNWGAWLPVELRLIGTNPSVTATWVSGGGSISVSKVSESVWRFRSVGQYGGNHWRTGVIRFTMTCLEGTASFDMFIRVGDPYEAYEPRSCFVAGSLVTMADGSQRPIEDIVPGDRVMTAVGSSIVTGLDHPLLGERPLYAFEDGSCKTSGEHSIWSRDPATNDEWWATRDMDQWIREAESGDGPDFVRKPYDLTHDEGNVWEFAHETGWVATTWHRVEAAPDTQLYHLFLEEGGSYYVDGYLVSSMASEGGVDWDTFTF